MPRYPFLFLLLVFGSGTLLAIDVSVNTDPTSAPTTRVTTHPAPEPKNTTTAPTTTASNGTTVAPTVTTTSATNVTTAAPTTPMNATTTAPPVTTAVTNATTAPPPVPTNGTTVAPPVPTTAAGNVTTAAPPVPTTAATNSTTEPAPVPTTAGINVTTAAPPPPPTTPVPPPAIGNYSVNDRNGTACLMATMGLQIGYKDDKTLKNLNVKPSSTVPSGKCGVEDNDASLELTFENSSITFTFSVDGGKFRLHSVNVTLVGDTAGSFSAANNNLSLWEASVGSSYMCRRDQAYNITDALVLHTTGLQVQPYRVQNNHYATADDCPADADESFIVPLIVGVSLGALTLIVLVAYLVGRSRSQMNGYQSL